METQSRILVEVFLLTQKTNWHDDLSSFFSLLGPLNLIPQNVSNSPSVEKKRSGFAQNESKGNQDPKSSSISASYTFLQPLLFSNPSRSKQEWLSHEQVWRHGERHWWLGPAIALRRKWCKRKKRDWLYVRQIHWNAPDFNPNPNQLLALGQVIFISLWPNFLFWTMADLEEPISKLPLKLGLLWPSSQSQISFCWLGWVLLDGKRSRWKCNQRVIGTLNQRHNVLILMSGKVPGPFSARRKCSSNHETHHRLFSKCPLALSCYTA